MPPKKQMNQFINQVKVQPLLPLSKRVPTQIQNKLTLPEKKPQRGNKGPTVHTRLTYHTVCIPLAPQMLILCP